MQRKAQAHWEGDLKEGNGTISTQSTVLNNTAYSFKTRFQSGIGTNPEELLAAAHAGCFTMAVAASLTKNGFAPEVLDTEAIVELDMVALKINSIHFEFKAKVNGLSVEKFNEIVADAKANCIISKILNMPITINALLAE
jgi:lipoyl-dependent peroxiredoxin